MLYLNPRYNLTIYQKKFSLNKWFHWIQTLLVNVNFTKNLSCLFLRNNQTTWKFWILIRVFVFPDPQPPALADNLYLPALAPNLCLPALTPNFYLPALVSPEPGLAYTNLIPSICIYWPSPTVFITVLWFCIYLLIYSSSSASSNISNISNFLGLDNTHISMPILVN